MTGAVQAAAGAAAAGGGHLYSVTVATNGSARGYNGNGTQPSPTTFRGQTISLMAEAIVSGNFTIRVASDVGNSGFRAVQVQRGTGTGGVITLKRTDATYSLNAGTESQWTWGSSGVSWAVADEGTVRTLQVIY